MKAKAIANPENSIIISIQNHLNKFLSENFPNEKIWTTAQPFFTPHRHDYIFIHYESDLSKEDFLLFFFKLESSFPFLKFAVNEKIIFVRMS